MPVFEYACRACGKEFADLVTATADVSCPGCGSEEVERKISGFRKGRSEDARIDEAAERLALADDSQTGKRLAEFGQSYDEDLSSVISEMYDQDQEKR